MMTKLSNKCWVTHPIKCFLMDEFHVRQTLQLGKSISTGEKSILNLVKL